MTGPIIIPVYAVAKAGPGDYAVLDLTTRTVVSKHRTKGAAMRVLARWIKPEPEPDRASEAEQLPLGIRGA